MIMDPATSKEEHEAMLNRKMEEMKKKSAELLRRHQVRTLSLADYIELCWKTIEANKRFCLN